MKAYLIKEVKNFMGKLLGSDSFDSFLLAEAERSELFPIELRVAFGYLLCAGISFFLYRNVKSLSHHMEPGA